MEENIAIIPRLLTNHFRFEIPSVASFLVRFAHFRIQYYSQFVFCCYIEAMTTCRFLLEFLLTMAHFKGLPKKEESSQTIYSYLSFYRYLYQLYLPTSGRLTTNAIRFLYTVTPIKCHFNTDKEFQSFWKKIKLAHN